MQEIITQASVISRYADAVFKASESMKDIEQEAINAYCSITDYKAMKELNKHFNEVLFQKAELAGYDLSQKIERDKCTAKAQYIRKQAKNAGWVQPVNPDAKPKEVKAPTIQEVVETKDADGNVISSVKLQAVLSNETIEKMVSLAVKLIPHTVYNALYTKEGKLKDSLLKSAEASLVSEETLKIVSEEMQALLANAQGKLEEKQPEYTPEQKKIQANQKKKAEEDKAKAEQAKAVNN